MNQFRVAKYENTIRFTELLVEYLNGFDGEGVYITVGDNWEEHSILLSTDNILSLVDWFHTYLDEEVGKNDNL